MFLLFQVGSNRSDDIFQGVVLTSQLGQLLIEFFVDIP